MTTGRSKQTWIGAAQKDTVTVNLTAMVALMSGEWVKKISLCVSCLR